MNIERRDLGEAKVVEDGVSIEYCGEWFRVRKGERFSIGQEADLRIDDNPFLHGCLLEIGEDDGMWFVRNSGSHLSVTVTDGDHRLQAWLAPAARLPLVFGRTILVFTAGPTTYEIGLYIAQPVFSNTQPSTGGANTVGVVALTVSQKQLIVALAEPILLRDAAGMADIPTSATAAARLGWALTRFNRKLDNVCEKLDRIGVHGLRGGARSHATNRRVRLVEYAIEARLVTRHDLPLLDGRPDG